MDAPPARGTEIPWGMPRRRPPLSTMGRLGVLLLVVGLLGMGWAMSMDTSVAVGDVGMPSELSRFLPSGMSSMRVNNLGLMHEQRNYLIFGGVIAVIGLVLVLVGRESST